MQLLLFSVQEKMEELLERLVFDVDAAVTEFTRKGTIVIELLEELEIREIFLSELMEKMYCLRIPTINTRTNRQISVIRAVLEADTTTNQAPEKPTKKRVKGFTLYPDRIELKKDCQRLRPKAERIWIHSQTVIL